MTSSDGALATQAERGRVFRALHERSGAFIIPNPWDVGTAACWPTWGLRRLLLLAWVTPFL